MEKDELLEEARDERKMQDMEFFVEYVLRHTLSLQSDLRWLKKLCRDYEHDLDAILDILKDIT